MTLSTCGRQEKFLGKSQPKYLVGDIIKHVTMWLRRRSL
jgi:hypothetical protein